MCDVVKPAGFFHHSGVRPNMTRVKRDVDDEHN